MMMKKTWCLVIALALAACLFSAASAASDPVTADELDAFLGEILILISAQEPLNDPSAESALNEDGVRFQYENCEVFCNSDEMSADTPVNALRFQDSEGAVFRGLGIDSLWEDVLAAFPNDNGDLEGTREEAVLYLRQTAGAGFVYGRVLRDGQRISAAEFGEVRPSGNGFRRAAVTFSLQSRLVTSIRMDGLNPDSAGMDAGEATELFSSLSALKDVKDYKAVKTSINGLDLTPFGPEDLTFGGISYTAISPETLGGMPESVLIDNDDGTWLLRCDGDGYAAVFRCDAEGKNAVILSYTILDEDAEGPRGVRLGDLFSDDFCRFRSGENETSEDMTEWLYGSEDTVPRGYADYNMTDGETTLRYVTDAGDGTLVELLLKYEENVLADLILHTLE